MQEPIPGILPGETTTPAMSDPVGRVLLAAAKLLAIIGGLIFVGLVVMSIVSIVGRKLASAPVPGDVELLQMIAAAACASFFAYCHLNQGDVKVDFFTASAPPAVVETLDALGSFLVGLVGAILTWRVFVGAMSVKEAGETSAILDIPIWWAQMAMVPGFALLALSGFYTFGQHAARSAGRQRRRT